MEKVSSKYADQAVVNVYHGDEIVEQVTRAKAKEMKATGDYFFFHHGRDIKKVTVCAPQTVIESALGWNMPLSMQTSGINRGAASHTGRGMKGRCHDVPNYPVPYVFEGSIKPMRVRDVNGT